MDDYKFTEAEQAVIEKAAERLEHVMVNPDAIDAAYAMAWEIRVAVAAATLEQAVDDVLAHRDELRNIPLAHGDIRREARLWGLEEAASVIRSRAQSLSHPTAEEIERHTSVIADLSADIDRQRPLGSDGKHETAETASDPLEWEDASPSDYLFVLRNTAGKAAESLAPEVERAQAVLERLNRLADDAEDAAQLVAASDIEPNMSANVPERSGLTRREATDAE